MISCVQNYNEIPNNKPDYNDDYYNQFMIVISLFLIIPSLYFLYRNSPRLLNVTPKANVIIVDKKISPDENEKNEIFSEMSSCGGFIPYLRKLHKNQGNNVTSVIVAKYPTLRNLALEFIERWEKVVMNDKNSIIKMQEECLEFSLRATLNVIVSSNEENLDVKTYKKSYDAVLSGLFDKQFGKLDTLHEERFQESINYMKSVTCKLIDQRRNELKTNNEGENKMKDLFDILVSENDPHTGKPFTDAAITHYMCGYTMAGYHTTGTAIPYTIFAITQNHDVQVKLREEIDKTLGGRLPTFDDLSSMEYLTQVVKESLRVYAPASFVARLLKSETILPAMDESKDLRLKANTTILYPIPLYHEDPKFFTQPEKFDPTRFSPDKIKNIEPNTYCPFGFGSRICPAERYALMDIKMVICLILQKFNVKLAMKLEDFVIEERFVNMAKNDVLIKLELRSK
ncbi:cytochrome P450 [Rhizophagus irregularis]|uniref:Cytochrome P450 n=1 Tax=Rhizophagus irregularis TaxID=588596 RepID=A0A2I1GLZ4_9GLOM|nr:cytochrome P450 [Rhizophagus irregularis]